MTSETLSVCILCVRGEPDGRRSGDGDDFFWVETMSLIFESGGGGGSKGSLSESISCREINVGLIFQFESDLPDTNEN